MIYHGAILRTYPVQPGKSHYRKAAVACCRAYFKSWDKTTRGPNSSGQRQADWTDPQFKFKAFSFPVLRPTLYSWKLENEVLENLEIVPEILEIVPEISGIVLPCIFNFKAKRTYSVKRLGNRVKRLQSPTACPGKGVPQRIPAQSVSLGA